VGAIVTCGKTHTGFPKVLTRNSLKLILKFPKLHRNSLDGTLSILYPNLFLPFSVAFCTFSTRHTLASVIYCTFADVNNLLVLSPSLFKSDFNAKTTVKLPYIYILLKQLQPTPTLRNFSDGHKRPTNKLSTNVSVQRLRKKLS